MKAFKILSIDFDYFQDVDRDTVINFYPDGIDLPYPLTTAVWTSVYSKHNPGYQKIQDVKINQKLFQDAFDIIGRQDFDTPVVIQQSHIGIWNEIEERCVRGQKVFLAHIDFHHDFMNDNEKRGIVDCGNWLYFLTHLYHTKLLWFTRKTSLECYKIKPEELPAFLDDLSYVSMLSQKFDFIYICRSDPWTPPHLDADFDKLVQFCQTTFVNVDIQDSVQQPRDMEEINNVAQQIDDLYYKMMAGRGAN